MRLLFGLILSLFSTVAAAQTCPTRPVGTTGNACASLDFVYQNSLGSALAANSIFIGGPTNAATGAPVSADCSAALVAGLANFTCTKTNGVAFVASATTDTTNASNISSGTLAAARGGAGTITGALKGNGAGVVTQAACADLSNGAASCSTDTTNATNIGSGTLAAGRLPAFGSADVSFASGGGAGTIAANAVTNAKLATATQNTVKGAATSTAEADLAVPSCSAATSALTWTTNTGFGCNTISGSLTAWSTYTPTVTCGTATFTTTSARSSTTNKTTTIELDFTVSSLGNCTNGTPLTFTLPNTPNSAAAMSGQVSGAGTNDGQPFTCVSRTVTSTMTCHVADNTSLAASERIQMTGVYENQ